MPYPSDNQLILLKSALGDRNESLLAWEAWSTTWVMEDYLDHGSFRLLPLVYKNLSSLKEKHLNLTVLKGIYKQAWYRNQKLFDDAARVIGLIQGNSVDVMLLKGTALSLVYYRDMGVRPMSDLDIMIPRDKAEMVISVLQDHGWEAEFPHYLAYNLKYGRSMMFRNDEGFECDVHWSPLFESVSDTDADDFWREAEDLELKGLKVKALCPADALLHTLVHGLKWNPEPPIRWVADTVTILRAADQQIDWQRFIDKVRQYKVLIQVHKALVFLQREFYVSIPESVMQTLAESHTTLAERMIFRFDVKNPRREASTFRERMQLLWIIYLRQAGRTNIITHGFGFMEFLLYRTRGKRLLVFGYYLIRKLRTLGGTGKRGGRIRLVAINLLVLIGLMALTELGFRVREHRHESRKPDVVLEHVYESDAHPVLGWTPVANTSHVWRKEVNGEQLYASMVTINDQAMRISPRSTAPQPHAVLFFGNSCTFGEGVGDSLTLPFQFGMRTLSEYQVYNFGVSGYGPHHMLTQLESGMVDSVVDQPVDHIVLQILYPDHVYRVAGYYDWNIHSPWYELGPDGIPVRRGQYADKPAARVRNGWFYRYTAVGRFLGSRNPRLSDAEKELFVSVILKAKRIADQKFNHPGFHVIVWNWAAGSSDRVFEKLQAQGIRLYDARDIFPEDPASLQYRLSPYDTHPNASAYGTMAGYLRKKLQRDVPAAVLKNQSSEKQHGNGR